MFWSVSSRSGGVAFPISIAFGTACGRPPLINESDTSVLVQDTGTSVGQRPDEALPEAREREMNTAKNAAFSPAGEPHPGVIVHDDKVDGRTWTRSASEVPPTIGWVHVGERWVPVTRIEITGTATQRRFTKFGADGAMLETTIQMPPPPQAPPRPSPMPVPTPEK